MVKKIKKILSKLCIKRTPVLFIVFAVMFFILLQRLFVLQIIKGEEYATNFNLTTTKTRTIKSTRGISVTETVNCLHLISWPIPLLSRIMERMILLEKKILH